MQLRVMKYKEDLEANQDIVKKYHEVEKSN